MLSITITNTKTQNKKTIDCSNMNVYEFFKTVHFYEDAGYSITLNRETR